MKKCVLFSLVILFVLSVLAYSGDLIDVTGKWLYYHPSKEIRIIIRGIDESGIPDFDATLESHSQVYHF